MLDLNRIDDIRILQQSCDVEPDGIIGPNTRHAVCIAAEKDPDDVDMARVILTRNVEEVDFTMGEMRSKGDGLGLLYTIERPWRDNERSISCIPAGTYWLAITRSRRFGRPLPLVHDVAERSGIRIHPANYAHELEGCIALGLGRQRDSVMDSRVAVRQFIDWMHNQPVLLTITSD